MEDVTGSVEAIEAEAEKLLEQARNEAKEILVKAKEEARKIVSAELSVVDVRTECENIVLKAREEADKKAEASRIHAAEIRNNASKKIEETVSRMVAVITGAKR